MNGNPELVTRWGFSDGGTKSLHCGQDGRWNGDLTITYRCGCSAAPSVSPGQVVAAVPQAHELGSDLYTDLPHYGLPQPLS